MITLAELHAVKAALIWISRQTIHERVIIHSDSMGALTIITTANFHTYPEIITEIYTTASTLKQRGIQVILHLVPSHINPEGNNRTDKLANEATSLDVIEYAEHTPGTVNHLVYRVISNRLESIYTEYTSASKDWYQKTTVVGHNILNNRLVDTQLRRLRSGPSPLTLSRHCQQVYHILIPWVLPLHHKTNFNQHVDNRITKCRNSSFSLSDVGMCYPVVISDTKSYLFPTICQPRLVYGLDAF